MKMLCKASVLGLELYLRRETTQARFTFIPRAHFTNGLDFIGILHVNKFHQVKQSWSSVIIVVHGQQPLCVSDCEGVTRPHT